MTRETFLDNGREILVGFYDTLAWAVGSELNPHDDCRALLSANTYNWLIEMLSPESPKPKTLFSVPVLIDEDLEDGVIKLYCGLEITMKRLPCDACQHDKNDNYTDDCDYCGDTDSCKYNPKEGSYDEEG